MSRRGSVATYEWELDAGEQTDRHGLGSDLDKKPAHKPLDCIGKVLLD